MRLKHLAHCSIFGTPYTTKRYILSRTTTAGAPINGGLETCGGLMCKRSSHTAYEASNRYDQEENKTEEVAAIIHSSP